MKTHGGALLRRHQEAFSLRGFRVLGDEHVSISSSSLWPTSGIRALGLCHACLSGGCLRERLGSLGLRIPSGSLHPEDCSEAFAYRKKRDVSGTGKGILLSVLQQAEV